MKKKFFMLLMLGVTLNVFAQNTKEVKGAVIDKNGNPLPGAKIEATGGAESTVTDGDGTFKLEVSKWLKSITATYPGYRKQKIGLKNVEDVIVNMRETENTWFLNAVGGYDIDYKCYNAGIMGGKLSNWGFYGKFLYRLDEDADNAGFSISIGLTKRISSPLYMYLGAGYTYYQYHDRWWTEYWNGYIAETGILFRYKQFNINVGVQGCLITSISSIGVHLGIGYCF